MLEDRSVSQPSEADQWETVKQGPDTIVRVLRYGVFLVLATTLMVVVYALLTYFVTPQAPRTRVEALLAQTAPAVKKNPADGKVWADYVQALYVSGDTDEAYTALKQAYKSTKGRGVLVLYNVELSMLIKDGRNQEALEKSTKYVQEDIYWRVTSADEQAKKKIAVTIDRQDNDTTVELFTLRATAEGNLGQWKEAVVSLDNALKLVPEAADVIMLRGWAKLGAKDKAGAKRDFEKALRYLPNDASAKRGLAAATASTTKKK